MTPYRNLTGTSGIVAYELTDDSIVVKFQKGGTYVYDHTRPGTHHVEHMKALAIAGQGLGTYISQHVKRNFARKL